MITHKGGNISNGHYIAFCREADPNNWKRCDDESIRDVSFQEVLHTEPYMLFYFATGREESYPFLFASYRFPLPNTMTRFHLHIHLCSHGKLFTPSRILVTITS